MRSREGVPAVGGHDDRAHSSLMPGISMEVTGRQIPKPERAVVGGRQGMTAIRSHRDGGHVIVVPGKGTNKLAGRQVPQPERAVVRGREGMAAVRGDRHRGPTLSSCPVNERRGTPVFRSHSLRVVSSEPESTLSPSGVAANAVTAASCPAEECGSSRWLVCRSQSLRVLS